MTITQPTIQESLDYDATTGELKWKIDRRGSTGIRTNAGTLTPKGYIAIILNGRGYLAHRLAWFLHYGQWPTHQLDHINGVKNDNRISNLREATNPENRWNTKAYITNTSGTKGIYFEERRQLWMGKIHHEGKRFRKASTSKEIVTEWLITKRAELHGEFCNHG